MSKSTKFVAAGAAVAVIGGMVALGTLSPLPGGSPLGTLTSSSVLAATVEGHAGASTFDAQAPAPAAGAAGSVVLGEPSGQSVAGWKELGRVQANNPDGSTFGEMRHLQALGDQLVAIGSMSRTGEGPTRDVVYHSSDGLAWTPATAAGRKARFADLATTGDRLVLGGSHRVAGKRKARLWTSSDGLAWRSMKAPPRLTRIDQVVSAGSPLVVRGGQALWAKQDGGKWRFVTRLVDMPILHGPGGFLASRFPDRVMLHWGDDLSQIREVPLPRGMGRDPALLADAQLFALDDRWLLVPHVVTNPDTIYMSADGLAWTEIPRPPGILAGAVRWMADVGDVVQAFGAIDGDAGDEGGIWTFVPSEPVGTAETMAGSDEFIDAPVTFGDGYAATGLKMGRQWELTSWARPIDP